MHDSMECGSNSYVVACCTGSVAVGVHILDGGEGEFGLLGEGCVEGSAIVIPGDDVQEAGFGERAGVWAGNLQPQAFWVYPVRGGGESRSWVA